MIFHDGYKRRVKPIEYEDKDGCWICTSHYLDKDGYPMICRTGRTQPMTRYVYEVTRGKTIEPGNIILHSCDNPSCINPEHLSEGSYMDNRNDMLVKGREYLKNGKDHYNSTVPVETIMKIKETLETSDLTQLEIAKKYGVAQSLVSCVNQGKHWALKKFHKNS